MTDTSGVHHSSGVHHIALRVADVAKACTFYSGVLGLTRLRAQREGRVVRAVWLSAGSTIVMVERRGAEEPPPDPRSLDAVIYAIDVADRGDLVARLRRRRVPIEGETPYTVYFRDLEGRRIGASHFPVELRAR